MKNIFFAALVFFGAVSFAAAAGIAEEARQGNERADMSYAVGMILGEDLLFSGPGLELNYDAFLRGFRDAMEGRETRFTMEEAVTMIQAAFMAAEAALWERNLEEGAEFMASNAQRPGVNTTASGLQYETIREGTGETPDISDVVLVHYRGTTIDGTEFDRTEEDRPIQIPLDMVIPGWSEGIRLMREGGKALLFIPPDLAYGDRGAGGVIEPNATLIFEVELISIVRAEAEAEE
ncbi:MAG: FKBP-type peptidyl-prolyl cis-trans isomerase [Treponema sp.]|nr:FKBP-type peptidyl-prolyl cis-trans isomerase [Treponema sp.]